MTPAQKLEDRVAFLEEEVRRLRVQVARGTGAISGRTAPDFLEQFSGIFANDPTFDEAVRLGREWREQDRPPQGEMEAD